MMVGAGDVQKMSKMQSSWTGQGPLESFVDYRTRDLYHESLPPQSKMVPLQGTKIES